MQNHIDIKDPSKCCGCRNCLNVCPKQAITFVENDEGFLYPQIDEKKCINCGLCKKKCPFLNKKTEMNNKNIRCYAASNSNSIEIKKSTSGGIFYLLAIEIINNNGLVVGAILDEEMKVKHIIAKDISELDKLCGSKYVCSTLSDIFKRSISKSC